MFLEGKEGVRLPYDPVVGFHPTIQEHEGRSEAYNQLVEQDIREGIEKSKAKVLS